MPEQYLHFSDAYNELTKQEPTKRVIQDWMLTFSEWIDEGLTVENIVEAYKHASRPEGGFLVGRPGSLTITAVAIKTKVKTQKPQIRYDEIESTKKMLEKKLAGNFTPVPDEVRRKMKSLLKEKSVNDDPRINRPQDKTGPYD